MNSLSPLLTILFSSILIIATYAQTSPTGLIFDDEGYNEAPLLPSDSIRGGKLPYQFSLRSYCPIPGDQGYTASCVGWALANALTIERVVRAKETNQSKIGGMRHSVFYIYNQIKISDCSSGAKLSDGLNLLKKKGDCLSAEFEDAATDCATLPNENQHRKAARFATKGYERLFNTTDDLDYKIDAIRSTLAKGQPVLIALLVPSDFKYKALKDLHWKDATYGHAMVIVGYNDGKKTFDLMNSYGTDWGNGGFFQLDYYTLANCARYAYRLLLDTPTGDK